MTEFTSIEAVWAFILQTANTYTGDIRFLCGAAAALVICAILGHRRFRVAFLYPALILLCTVFNPVLLYPVFSRYPELARGYYECFWLIPFAVLLPLAVVMIVDKLPGTVPGVIVLVIAFFLPVLCGSPAVRTSMDLTLPMHISGVSEDVRAVCDLLREQTGKDNPVVLFEDDIGQWARLYDAEIVLADLDGFPADTENLKAICEEGNIDLIVVAKDGTTSASLLQAGFTQLDQTAKYVIFSGRV